MVNPTSGTSRVNNNRTTITPSMVRITYITTSIALYNVPCSHARFQIVVYFSNFCYGEQPIKIIIIYFCYGEQIRQFAFRAYASFFSSLVYVSTH